MASKNQSQHDPLDPLLKQVPWPAGQFRPASRDLYDESLAYGTAARLLAGDRAIGGLAELPIIFLYRHALELSIKAVLTEESQLGGICRNCVLNRSHNLKRQLPDMDLVCKRYGVKLSQSARDLVLRWHKDDEMGMRARYSLARDGHHDPLKHSDRFDLKSLVFDCESALNELDELFQAVSAAVYAHILETQINLPPEDGEPVGAMENRGKTR